MFLKLNLKNVDIVQLKRSLFIENRQKKLVLWSKRFYVFKYFAILWMNVINFIYGQNAKNGYEIYLWYYFTLETPKLFMSITEVNVGKSTSITMMLN